MLIANMERCDENEENKEFNNSIESLQSQPPGLNTVLRKISFHIPYNYGYLTFVAFLL